MNKMENKVKQFWIGFGVTLPAAAYLSFFLPLTLFMFGFGGTFMQKFGFITLDLIAIGFVILLPILSFRKKRYIMIGSVSASLLMLIIFGGCIASLSMM